MVDINTLVRKNIRDLKPYSSARSECTGNVGNIFLDANEMPWGKYNRYPQAEQELLKKKIGKLKSISTKKIFIGNGSDEAIDLLFRIFCNPGQDKAVCFTPTYGMYSVAAAIHDIQMLEIPLDHNFQLEDSLPDSILNDMNNKLLFICSPNNPTGNLMDRDKIYRMLETFKGIVIVDEAYIDFAGSPSFINEINTYPNLVVLQTLSKAWGMAALRVGCAFANETIIRLLHKVKPPYSISTINEKAALRQLDNEKKTKQGIKKILNQREKLEKNLCKMVCVKKVYPSRANFLLVEMEDAESVYTALLQKSIVVRNRHSIIPNCLRITIGSARENNLLIKALKEI